MTFIRRDNDAPDHLGDLDRVARVVKLNGFVQCVDGFTGQPTVVNGASDLLAEVGVCVLTPTRYVLHMRSAVLPKTGAA